MIDKNHRKLPKHLSHILVSLLSTHLSFLGIAMMAEQAHSAETIHVNLGPVERTISVDDIETFAEEGELPDELKDLNRVLDDEVIQQIRQLLKQPIAVSALEVSQLTYAPLGEDFLERLGTIIQTESGQNGFYALRSAVILASNEPEGFTLINGLHYFPTEGIRINLVAVFEIIRELNTFTNIRDTTLEAIARQSAQEIESSPDIDFSQLPDLQQLGEYAVQKQELILTDESRSSLLNANERQFNVDLYLPNDTSQPVPVIGISHGLGAQRSEFSVLANHLASHGFAVFVPEHVGSNAELGQLIQSGQYFGKPDAIEFIDRPQDISFVLDELERFSQTESDFQNRLDLSQVGIIGHSFGGYTALALAAGEINEDQLGETCSSNTPTLNLSLILQCQAVELPPASINLSDSRISAILALNPVSSAVLGSEGFSQVDVPVMMVQSSQDILTPMVPEQLIPFSWLTTEDKYLVTLVPGGHGSANQAETFEENLANSLLTGPNTDLGSRYTRALSVAFMQRYVSNQSLYASYLNAAYPAYMSQEMLNVNLVTNPIEIPGFSDRPTASLQN